MKRYINKLKLTILTLVLTGSLVGCGDFLTMDNPSSVTTEYYQTLAGQKSLLTAIYSRWRGVYNTGELQYYGTDLYMAVSEGQNEKMFDGYDKTFNSTAGIVGDYWKNLYKIVQECNTLISVCSPDVTGADCNSYIAQAKFMRALAYYYLVETFGDVPYLTEANGGIIESAVREDEKIIYAGIIEDVKGILGVLPVTQDKAGYISNTAIQQLLGKLYLTKAYKSYADANDFETAAEYFDTIIADKNHTLLSSYSDVFNEMNQGNNEVIWAIQYGLDKNFVGDGNSQQSQFGINFPGLQAVMFGKVQDDYSNMGRKYWVIPTVHKLFTDPIVDTRYDVTFAREFDVNNPDHASFGKPGLYFPRWNAEDENGAILTYTFEDNKGNYNWMPSCPVLGELSGNDYMPIINKFKDTQIEWAAAGSREDVVMRVGDTYLLSAEAHLGAGNADVAKVRVQSIRDRARAGNIEGDFDLDYILDERAREMLGEHDRWFDLKRTRTLLSRTKKYNFFVQAYDNINANHMVRPIPQDEMNKVNGLIQNPGY